MTHLGGNRFALKLRLDGEAKRYRAQGVVRLRGRSPSRCARSRPSDVVPQAKTRQGTVCSAITPWMREVVDRIGDPLVVHPDVLVGLDLFCPVHRSLPTVSYFETLRAAVIINADTASGLEINDRW
jgi:hypothetical protein